MRSNLLVLVLFACVFQSIYLLVAGALSGKFDLRMIGTEDKPPYPKLKKIEMIDGNTIPAARHHIIPRNRIKEFYNKAVVAGKMKNLRLFLAEYKKQFKDLYKSTGKNEMIKNVEELVDGLIAGTVVQDDDSIKPKNYSYFIAFYMWLPGNLFIGPNTEYRADDPKEEFESKSKRIIGEDDFERRLEINDQMKKYVSSSQDQTDFTKLDTDLQRMLTTRKGHPIASLEAYPFDKNDWIRAPKKGKYKINDKVVYF